MKHFTMILLAAIALFAIVYLAAHDSRIDNYKGKMQIACFGQTKNFSSACQAA